MAKDKAKEDVKKGEETGEKPKKSKKLLILLGILLLGAVGGGAAWYVQVYQNAGPRIEKPKPPIFVTLDTFTVNLQSSDGVDHFLQVGIDLRVADDSAVEAIKLHMPEIRNSVLLLLSGKHVEELSSTEGKQRLSAEILEQVNKPLNPKAKGPGKQVLGVYFTSFVIQ